ncbi:hypothetical protein CRG98_036880, partial [Punica granatum]
MRTESSNSLFNNSYGVEIELAFRSLRDDGIWAEFTGQRPISKMLRSHNRPRFIISDPRRRRSRARFTRGRLRRTSEEERTRHCVHSQKMLRLNLRAMLILPFRTVPTRLKPICYSSSSSSLYSSSPTPSPLCINYTPWSGLESWRQSPLNENRSWGPNGPEPLQRPTPPPVYPNRSAVGAASSLAEMGALVLSTGDPIAKAELSHLAFSRWRNEKLPMGVFPAPGRPARPPKPEL